VGASGSSFSGSTFASENMEAALNVADMFTQNTAYDSFVDPKSGQL
jgi:hypothetical protein